MSWKGFQQSPKVQSAAQYQQLLCSEVDSTVERFTEFSMSTVITVLGCPQLYQLVQQLGCTPRNARWLSTRRRAERRHGSLYSSEYTACKGEGTAVNDQSDAGRKGNRQTGTCTYMYRVCTHIHKSF